MVLRRRELDIGIKVWIYIEIFLYNILKEK